MNEFNAVLKSIRETSKALADLDTAAYVFRNRLQDAIKTLEQLADDQEAMNERVAISSTLDTFPSDGSDPIGDALDPTPSIEQLQNILKAASQKIGIEKVRQVVQENAGGRKVADMKDEERRHVRVHLELHGVNTREFLK